MSVGTLELDPGTRRCRARRHRHQPHRARVRAARVPHAQGRQRGVEARDPRSRVGHRLRRRPERRRGVRRLPAQEDRRAVRARDDARPSAARATGSCPMPDRDACRSAGAEAALVPRRPGPADASSRRSRSRSRSAWPRSGSCASCTTTWSTASKRRTSSSSTSCRRRSIADELQPPTTGQSVLLPRQPGSSVGCEIAARSTRRLRRERNARSRRQAERHARRAAVARRGRLARVDSSPTCLLIVGAALIALVGFAAWFFAGRALRPVEAIRLQAESITGTTIDRRVPEPATHDEVGRLARTMNAMLDRLETSSQKQRQFVSDASHELRSPIASIRTNLEVALRNPDRTDWPAVAQRARWPRTSAWRTR